VNVAFPSITDAFLLETRSIRWVVICYVLTYSSLMLAFGKLGDRIGWMSASYRSGGAGTAHAVDQAERRAAPSITALTRWSDAQHELAPVDLAHSGCVHVEHRETPAACRPDDAVNAHRRFRRRRV
jgi:hypothetical protein